MSFARLLDGMPDLRGAACAGHPYPDLFFPEHRNNMARDAKEVCDGCPVRLECRTWAQKTREPFGVWGGETEQERALAVRPRAPKAATSTDWRCGSVAGHAAHRRRNETPCDPCREAQNAYKNAARERARQSA